MGDKEKLNKMNDAIAKMRNDLDEMEGKVTEKSGKVYGDPIVELN